MVLEISQSVDPRFARKFPVQNELITLSERNSASFIVHGIFLNACLVHDKISPAATVNIFTDWNAVEELAFKLRLESGFSNSHGSHHELIGLLKKCGYFPMNASDILILEKILSWRRTKQVAQIKFSSAAVSIAQY